ncbi:MAG: hypothetical protein QF724_13490, partial [Planctomycetota bacterium]|nr:hypothetical protein [Planctomycetota bacterium]
GLSALALVTLAGLWASATHLRHHHSAKDGRAGMSLEDLTASYHGIDSPAPLVDSLAGGHPTDLLPEERALLLDWLNGDQLSAGYDNPDLGDMTPAELIDAACLPCHARGAPATLADNIGDRVPLEYWDDIERIAFSRVVAPVPAEIMITSAHTHALSMSMLALVIGAIFHFTRWSRPLRGFLSGLCGLALLVDFACWVLSRETAELVIVLAASGAAYGLSLAAMLILIMADLWLAQADQP